MEISLNLQTRQRSASELGNGDKPFMSNDLRRDAADPSSFSFNHQHARLQYDIATWFKSRV